MTGSEWTVLRGVSSEKDEVRAVEELHSALAHSDLGLVVFFCSSKYDLDRLGTALRERFSCPLLGCTTAGEIAPSGYAEGSLVGVSLSSSAVTARVALIEPLDEFSALKADKLAQGLAPPLDKTSDLKRFGFLLIDGLSLMEEQTVAHLHNALGGIPIAGGSAGDDMAFRETRVYAQGRFAKNAAAFCVIDTPLPFRIFKTQHFELTELKLVITEADPPRRRVLEIDGMPAADAYAEALGLTREQLNPGVFSAHPVILQLGGDRYVRSIQRVESDGSLVFYCAIDNGLVLTIAKGVNLTDHLRAQLESLERELRPLQLILACDCILRRLECQDKQLLAGVNGLFGNYPIVGFSTYGEQIHGIHVNQTLTGVALGGRP